MNTQYDIDTLKTIGTPTWFGLGFIQLRIDQKRRMHFWHPELKPLSDQFQDEYHDHRYDFTSRVIVGEITNVVVSVKQDPTSPDMLYSVCCAGGGAERLYNVTARPLCRFTTTAGNIYHMSKNAFHIVEASRCVTLQTRQSAEKEKAHVVRPNDTPSPNPFSASMPIGKMWEYIEDLMAP